FKLEYHTADMSADRWVIVDLKAQLTGSASFKPAGTTAVTVRLSMMDLAKNAGSDQVEVAAAAPPIGVPVPPPNAGIGTVGGGGFGSPFPTRAVGMVRDHVPPMPDTLEPITTPGGPVPPRTTGGPPANGAIAATGPQGPSMTTTGGSTPPPARVP